MKQITKHFLVSEFDCKDGTDYPAEWIETRLGPLAEALEVIRKKAKDRILVLSGYRTKKHNDYVGGAKDSMHMRGIAADIVVKDKTPVGLCLIIEKLIKDRKIPDGGLGLYSSFVHYDIRTLFGRGPKRW